MKKSGIEALEKKVASQNYQQYLREIKLENVRAFKNQKVSFDFPVTAIIGTNGGGKSTVLGAAALAYDTARPRDYFPKSTVSDSTMSGWNISYEVIDRNAKVTGKNSARFVDKRWRRDGTREREVKYFPIQRTVPAAEISRYRKYICQEAVKDFFYEEFDKETIKWTSRVLGRDTSGYRKVSLEEEDEDYILVGEQGSIDFSQFHFGAGEASIIEIVSSIEDAPKSSLILIEEVENGLHPLAVTTLVEYFLDVSMRKSVQVIFTTHSSDALKPLPSSAVWACIDGKTQQGVLDIKSLRAMIGDVPETRVVFAEDAFARGWLEAAIRAFDRDLIHETQIVAAGGYPFNLQQAKHHNLNKTISSRAVALVDGDQGAQHDDCSVVLPGNVPESEVFEKVFDKFSKIGSKLRQRLNEPSISVDEVKVALDKARISADDSHDIFDKVSQELGFLSEIVIREAFFTTYNELEQAVMIHLVAEVREKTNASND